MRTLVLLLPLAAAFVSIIGAIVSLLGQVAPDRLPNPRRKVHYNVHYDAFIEQRAESEIKDIRRLAKLIVQRPDGGVVPNPSVAMIRINNDGGLDIEEKDWSREIEFSFDGRAVEGVEVSDEFSGNLLRDRIISYAAQNSDDKKKLMLPKITLNKKDRFRLLVLLSGKRDDPKGYGVSGDAQLHSAVPGGGLVREIGTGTGVTRTFWWAGISVACIGISMIVVFVLKPLAASTVNANCVAGSIAS